MGQKVHPLGFRVGITKKHQSQWFARFNKYKYAQSVLEDRMLRQTLTSLFPQLLNPVLKKQNALRDKNEESSVIPKITQIKIERGLIPYEIGIQIHAENCELIKKSIENLKVNRDLLCHLQKTRYYLQHLQLKLNDFTTASLSSSLNDTKEVENEKSSTDILNSEGGNSNSRNKRKDFVSLSSLNQRGRDGKFKPRLTTQQVRRQRLVLKRLKKRLKKRQAIRSRYKQLVYNGFLLTKKGNKVFQTLKKSTISGFARLESKKNKPGYSDSKTKQYSKVKSNGKSQLQVTNTSTLNKLSNVDKRSTKLFKSRIKKKFVSVFLNRMKNKFLQTLKDIFASNLQTKKELSSSLSWSKKWNFNSVKKELTLKPFSQLTKLSLVLEQKSVKKLESLRKDFIASGLISKTEAINYYQMLMFLKQLKELITQIKKQKVQILLNKLKTTNRFSELKGDISTDAFAFAVHVVKAKGNKNQEQNNTLIQNLKSKGSVSNTTLNVLTTKLSNIENECRKVQFIEYLKQVVKKHRTNNIYLYLSTIADARKDLRKLQKFTKRNAAFLFGSSISAESTNIKTSQRVSNLFKQSNATLSSIPISTQVSLQAKEQVNNLDYLPSLSEVFLEQIEKQRNMYQDNVQLTPKIAIKFYSVNSNSLKAKASVVADTIVDALEKRKAFRKVIKDAKDQLMQTSGVKGAKIQVSGRLNGAEIARSEWVRAGRLPLQTLDANLDYAYKTANTIYGIIGIKVWIFKGYTKLI